MEKENNQKIRMIKHQMKVDDKKIKNLYSEIEQLKEKMKISERRLIELSSEGEKTIELNAGKYTATQLKDILNNRFKN